MSMWETYYKLTMKFMCKQVDQYERAAGIDDCALSSQGDCRVTLYVYDMLTMLGGGRDQTRIGCSSIADTF